jgi:GH24 family phage-related lysozyme (muramidase)
MRRLTDCVRHTDLNLSHHRAFWEAVEAKLPPGSLANTGELGSIWTAAVAPKDGLDPTWLQPAVALLHDFEGLRLQAYQCEGGAWSIGWGSRRIFNRAVRQGDTISRTQADAQFRLDVDTAAGHLFRLLPLVKAWPANRIAALVSFTYNIGPGDASAKPPVPGLETSTLRRRLLAGEDPVQVISQELPRWNKAKGKVSEGLTRRRNAEVELFAGRQLQQAPPVAPPVAPAGGLDPRGTEESGMVGPAKKAPVKPGDSYLLVNDRDQQVEAYDHTGKLLWKAPCLARGQGADNDWRTRNSDTPPGLYKIGQIYRDYERVGDKPAFDATLRSYGWYSFDMIELENQEAKHGRAGIMLHGGGTACGWPGAWAPKQRLHSTFGCLRMHNIDLRDKVLPLTKKGTVYIGVHQER